MSRPNHSSTLSKLHYRCVTAAHTIAHHLSHMPWESTLPLQMGMIGIPEALGFGLLMTTILSCSFPLNAASGYPAQKGLAVMSEIAIALLGFASIDSESLALVVGEFFDQVMNRVLSLEPRLMLFRER